MDAKRMKRKERFGKMLVFGLVFATIFLGFFIAGFVNTTKAEIPTNLFEGPGPFEANVDHVAGAFYTTGGYIIDENGNLVYLSAGVHEIHYMITSHPKTLEDSTPLITISWITDPT